MDGLYAFFIPTASTDLSFRRTMNVVITMYVLRSTVAIAVTLLLIGCSTKPEVTFTTPPAKSSSSASRTSSLAAASSKPVPVQSSSVAKSVQIDVPFASQAPLANWGDPYQEACEEASLILVHHYLTGEPLSPEIMDKEILAIVAWETEHGYGHDVTMDQLAEIARAYYGHDATVRMDVSVSSVKEEVSGGNPVILPLAGREIGNPYYSGEGPWYHALVVTGYDGSHFITNDVGTRRGEDYAYPYDVLLDAVHDWTGVKEEIDQGRKAMVIVR